MINPKCKYCKGTGTIQFLSKSYDCVCTKSDCKGTPECSSK